MIFCWLEGIDAADKSFALILLVVTAPLTGTGAGGLGGEDSWVRGVMEDKSFASMEELELGSGLKLININVMKERQNVSHLFFLFSKFLALTLSFLLTRSCLYLVIPLSDILT